jgi:hypothetical protein
VVAGANGSVFVSGTAWGLIDLDPGPSVAMRWAGPRPDYSHLSPGSFVVKLASDASFVWGQTFPDALLQALASTSDGGVLAVSGYGTTGSAVVAKLGADGSSGWTFAIGGVDTSADSVAARGNTFVVAGGNRISGSEDGAADFDPGAGTQILGGNIRYLSRFTF